MQGVEQGTRLLEQLWTAFERLVFREATCEPITHPPVNKFSPVNKSSPDGLVSFVEADAVSVFLFCDGVAPEGRFSPPRRDLSSWAGFRDDGAGGDLGRSGSGGLMPLR